MVLAMMISLHNFSTYIMSFGFTASCTFFSSMQIICFWRKTRMPVNAIREDKVRGFRSDQVLRWESAKRRFGMCCSLLRGIQARIGMAVKTALVQSPARRPFRL